MATSVNGANGLNPTLNKPASKQTTFLTLSDQNGLGLPGAALGVDGAKAPAGGAQSTLALDAGTATGTPGGLADAGPPPADGVLRDWGLIDVDLDVPDRPDEPTPHYGDVPVPPVPEPKPEPKPEPPPVKPIEGQTFKSWGDPHEITGDGLKFDNQLLGDFVALRSKSGDFELQKRHEHVSGHSDGVTFNTEAALKTNGNTIHFDSQHNALTINGTKANLADGQTVAMPGGGSVTRNGNNYTITTAQGDSVTFIDQGNYMDIEGKMSASRGDGEIMGSLGRMDADSDASNDLVLPDGTLAKDVQQFLEAWRVGGPGSGTPKLIPGYAEGSADAPTAGSLAANRIMFDALAEVNSESEKRRKQEALAALRASDAAAAAAKAPATGTPGSTPGSSPSPSPTPAPSPAPAATPSPTPVSAGK